MGKVETEWSEDQGHYLQVTERYQQGCIVIKEPPLVFSLPVSNWRSQCRRCLAMLQTKKTVYPCSRCFGAHYCCTRCAELDNVNHIGSAECLLMQANQIRSCAARPFMREACLAARLLYHAQHAAVALESNQEALLDKQGASGQETQDLMTIAVAVATARAQATADVANVRPSPAEPDIAAALTAVCQIATNALEVMPCLIEHCMPGLKGGPAGVGIPLALYRLTSKINHSCCPNAAYFFKPDGAVVVRSMRAIQPSEQLTISYTDLLQTLDERQQSLMQRYAFACCCARCMDDSPMPGDWFLDAVAADDLERATDLSHDLRRLLRRGSALLLEEGSAGAAVCVLEPGLMQLTGSGVHPLHSSCLDIYTCLSSAWRLLARGNKHKPVLAASAYARGALYTLLLAHGLKQLLKSGVDGILPHHARQLSDAASSMCACLKIFLELHQPQADDQPPPTHAKRSVNETSQVKQGQLLQRPHRQQQQQQQECALQRLQPSKHMQQQQQCLQEHIQDPLPMVSSHTGRRLTQLPSHSQLTLAEGMPHMAQKPANQEAALEGVQQVALEGTQKAALEGALEAAQAFGDVWQLLINIGTASKQELHSLLAQQCREEDVQVPSDFKLADELQLATLGARSHFHAAGVSPSGLAILRPVLAHMASALQLDSQHEQQLVRLAAATSACLAAASDALQVAFGAGHQLCEVNSFLSFSSGLVFDVAAAVTQAASAHRAL
ncbi:hypothetical protein WJX77_002132 [Trebouxia sp. C0004]